MIFDLVLVRLFCLRSCQKSMPVSKVTYSLFKISSDFSFLALYFTSLKKIESRFSRNVSRLRCLTDTCLAQYLGSQILETHIAKCNGPVLAATISRLRKLPLLLLPGEKLDIIVQIFDDIRDLIKNSNADEYGADELLPILEFILIRGAIQNLGLEIQFVKDFLHPDIQGGEKGLWFCHFYAAYKSLSKA